MKNQKRKIEKNCLNFQAFDSVQVPFGKSSNNNKIIVSVFLQCIGLMCMDKFQC